MKFLVIFILALVNASALELPKSELKTRSNAITAGRPEGRITHGHNALPGQFPYQVGLSSLTPNDGWIWCGASLISNQKVLTAAHCTEGVNKAIVYLGSTRRRVGEVTHQVTSKDIIIHPGFAWSNISVVNDISIINIPYTPYSQNIQPVKLPSLGSSQFTYEGEEVIASGWGLVSDNVQDLSDDLQFAHMNVLPNQVCRLYYIGSIIDSEICIYTKGGISTCKGDSGGPLVLASTNTQIGLTSFTSVHGCELGYPAVFTRLTSYLDWIKENAGVAY